MHANKYKVVFVMNDAFPVNTLYLMRGAIYAKKNNIIEKYNETMFNAMWMSNINLSEPSNIIIHLKREVLIVMNFYLLPKTKRLKMNLKCYFRCS